MTKFRLILAAALFYALPADAAAVLPWQQAIAPDALIAQANAVEAWAKVTVSDGLSYDTFVSWLDNERAIFHRQYPERMVTLGRDGEFYWAYDGNTQSEMSAIGGYITLGHQFHAFLLRTEDFIISAPDYTDSEACDCRVAHMTLKTGQSVSLHFDRASSLPIQLISDDGQGETITTSYQKWSAQNGYLLPGVIEIEHAGRTFQYDFVDITLFSQPSLNGNLEHASFRPPFDRLSAEHQLIRLHRDMIDAHIESNIDLMANIWADEIIQVNRGQITVNRRDESLARMGASLKRRKHTSYLDLERPRVRLSADQTMGQVYVRIHAAGNSVDADGTPGEPFEFTAAWQASFQKDDGRWVMISNASSFQ